MIDSSPQLRLRILTGTHAGAEICLSQGEYAMGSDPTCNIVISDWPFRRSAFTILNGSSAEFTVRFEDETVVPIFGINAPQSIGNVVIVASLPPGQGSRPSDLELLKTLLVPVPPAVHKRSGVKIWMVAGIMIVASAVSAFALHSTGSVAATKAAPALDSPLAKVRNVVRKMGYPGIRVSVEGEAIVVAGLVKDIAERQHLATELSALHGIQIQQRYAVESEIAATISDALAQPGVVVRHVGGGRFEISGNVTQVMRDRTDLDRLKNDMGPLVKSLAFSALQPELDVDAEFDGAQTKAGYQFRIAPDGSKYFVTRTDDFPVGAAMDLRASTRLGAGDMR